MINWFEGLFIGLQALAVAGLVMVLQQHVGLAWWEGAVLSFGIMILFGGRRF